MRDSEAGVRKASKEETAGEFAPAVVSGYGDLAARSDWDGGRASTATVLSVASAASERVMGRRVMVVLAAQGGRTVAIG